MQPIGSAWSRLRSWNRIEFILAIKLRRAAIDMRLVWKLGGDVNAVDKKGETAMHGAAYKHVPSVVRFLAENGAKVAVWNHQNDRGWTPLKIVEGIPVGMNIAGDEPTRLVIRELLSAAGTTK